MRHTKTLVDSPAVYCPVSLTMRAESWLGVPKGSAIAWRPKEEMIGQKGQLIQDVFFGLIAGEPGI